LLFHNGLLKQKDLGRSLLPNLLFPVRYDFSGGNINVYDLEDFVKRFSFLTAI